MEFHTILKFGPFLVLFGPLQRMPNTINQIFLHTFPLWKHAFVADIFIITTI